MKNKIFNKILLVVVCVSVLVSSFVITINAEELNTNNTLNNPYNNNCVLPVGYMSVSNAINNISSPITDGYSPLNVPLFNYVGSGQENIGTYTSDFPAVNSAIHRFVNAPLYSVNGLPSGFYGFLSGGSVDYNSSDSTWNERYNLTRLNSIHLNNVLLVSSGYNWMYIKFSELFNNLDPSEIGLNYTISCTYYSESLDSFIDYTSPTITTSAEYDDSWFYRVLYIPDEIIQSDGLVYIRNYTITFRLTNTYPLDMLDFGYETRLSVPDKETFNSYVNTMIDSGYDTGYNTGYNNGYNTGFNDGVESTNVTIFDSILNAVSSFIDWEFIPGVSFGIILTIIVGVCLILTFLKFFAGG